MSVLRVRHEYLPSKNITDFRHVLTEDQRGEFVKCASADCEHSEYQRALQDRDAEKGEAKGNNPPE
eukprot:4174431-Pyramimonas_sp.AAC.1